MAYIDDKLTKKTNLDDMEIGDYIPCRYTAKVSNVPGSFTELGTCTATELPTTPVSTPDGLFNFIKVDNGTLIADRVVQSNINWNNLNKVGYVEDTKLNGLGITVPNVDPNTIVYKKTNDLINVNVTDNLINITSVPGLFGVALNTVYNGSGDFYCEFYIGEPSGAMLLGISDGNISPSYSDSKYYYQYNGNLYPDDSPFGPTYTTGDTISMKVNFDNKTILFFKNGQSLTIKNYTFSTPRITILNGSSHCSTSVVVNVVGNYRYPSLANNCNLFSSTTHTPTSINHIISNIYGGSSHIDYLDKKETSVLLHFEGDDNSKEIINENQKYHFINNNVILKNTEKKIGNSSAYFNGTNSFLEFTYNPLLIIDDDFTIEWWEYITDNNPNPVIMLQATNTSEATYDASIAVGWTQSGLRSFFISSSGSSWDVAEVASMGVPILNAWTHYALCRKGDKFYAFQNGLLKSTITSTAPIYFNISYNLYIGSRSNLYFKGYMDEVRIVKYKALYTENFTPSVIPSYYEKAYFKFPIASNLFKDLGNYPQDNEWDKYIVNSDLNKKIEPGDCDIWHYKNFCWTQSTPVLNSYDIYNRNKSSSTSKFYRGVDRYYTDGGKASSHIINNSCYPDGGFRPVLKYIDTSIPINNRPSTLYY